MRENIKCVVVGDATVPKVKFIHFYQTKIIDDVYIPAVEDSICINLNRADSLVELSLWNTAGQEEYQRLRPLTYTGANVYLLAFHYDQPASIEGLRNLWCSEVKHYSPNAVFILVGMNETQAESAEIERGRVSLATNLCKELELDAFVQCSLNNLESINQVFDLAVLGALASKKELQSHEAIREQVLMMRKHETPEDKFITTAVTIAKSLVNDETSGPFATLPIDIVKSILFFVARNMGCSVDPRYAIHLILKNVRDPVRSPKDWEKLVVVDSYPKTIFRQRFLPFVKYIADEPEKKPGCIIS